jgi:dethiobiotin synthetase
MTAVFVTATGTDIGKTFVARGLIHELRRRGRTVDALKPVVSGYEPLEAEGSDPGLLLAAVGQPVTQEAIARIAPWRFAAPVSPHTAARREGRTVDFAELVAFTRHTIAQRADALVVEGAGGIMVPLNDTHTVLDLMGELCLPVILVAGSYLGTISHTLSALEVLDRRSLQVAAVVVSQTAGSPVPFDETVGSIAHFAPTLAVIAVPRLSAGQLDHPAFARIAERL